MAQPAAQDVGIEGLPDHRKRTCDGGKVTMPLADAFWGARFGMLVDKFGLHWMFNCELPKKA